MPSLKQKLAALKLVENSGNIGKAMIDAGYSPKTDTTNLTKSKGWEELMEKHFPDSKIALKIEEGLEANRVISAVNTNKEATAGTTDFIEVPDHAIRHKFVETALKVKRKMPELGDKDNPFKIDINVDIGSTLKKIYGQRNNGSAGKVLNGSS
jgi:hypothetical protein